MSLGGVQYCSFRNFYKSAILTKVSQQANVMIKLMRGTLKKKTNVRYSDTNPIKADILSLKGKNYHENTKVSSRRVNVMNSVYLERITDVLSTSVLADTLREHGFFVTKVKYASDGSAIHVYWSADSDLAGLQGKLPRVGGVLRHELSQLKCGHVPHINLIFDRTYYKANDVEELLNKIMPEDNSVIYNKVQSNELKETLVKNSNILGINRDEIINQVLKSMRRVPSSTESSRTNDPLEVQRQIDFKKYLREQTILKEKMARKGRSKGIDQISINELGNSESTDVSEDLWEEDDYIDEDEETRR